MADRPDIDALLISALYGELTPADEARLTAHLESHPADRTALDDLTRTRAAIRESRILATQLEPPQSISSLLLQEAARRAPRSSPTESWFQRFVRAFAAHPAMAAAATLVLVVGVAGLLYMRNGDPFSAPQAEHAALAPASSFAPTTASEKAAEPRAAGSAAAQVGDNGFIAAPEGAADGAPAPSAPSANKASSADRDDLRAVAPAKAPARLTKGGIEVHREEPTPKDFEDDSVVRSRVGRLGESSSSGGAGGTGAVVSQAPAATAAPAPAPVKPMPATTIPDAPTPPPIETSGDLISARSLGADKAAKPAPRAASPAMDTFAAKPEPLTKRAKLAKKSAPRDEAKSEEAKSEEAKPELPASDDQVVLGWAQRQRDQVIAYVRANNCRAAAAAATEVYNRAPDYYASNIASDRSIKPCATYLNNERETVDRKRAAGKRTNSDESTTSKVPNAAAPAPRK